MLDDDGAGRPAGVARSTHRPGDLTAVRYSSGASVLRLIATTLDRRFVVRAEHGGLENAIPEEAGQSSELARMAQWQLADGRVVLLTDIEPEIGGCDGDPARQDEARSAEALALNELVGECPIFCVSVIWSMLPERSKDDDDFERTAGRTAEGLQAA